jgi:hypothetical protein
MAAEYLANAAQTIITNGAATFTASIPCNCGCIYHEDETGIFILRGITNSPCARFVTYQITFNGNIAVSEGGTVGPISMAIAVNGEPRPTSNAIVTPAAVGEYNNITSTCIVKVPRGCCFAVSVRNTSEATSIDLQNANLVINKMP